MQNAIRHEEYVHFSENLPFFFHFGIFRAPTYRSAEQNWHENPEIQLCTSGRGYVLLDGEKIPFEKGDFIVANSNVVHYTSTDTTLVYSCLIIDVSFCKQMGIDHTSLSFSVRFQSEELERDFARLQALYADHENPYRLAELNETVLKILIELCKNHSSRNPIGGVKKRSFENVKSAIVYIRSNFQNKISLDELSKAVYADKYALSRDFKKLTGQTIVQYINRYRCQTATNAITKGDGVAEAAFACGFENMSFFTKTFKKYMGKLPSEYKPK